MNVSIYIICTYSYDLRNPFKVVYCRIKPRFYNPLCFSVQESTSSPEVTAVITSRSKLHICACSRTKISPQQVGQITNFIGVRATPPPILEIRKQLYLTQETPCCQLNLNICRLICHACLHDEGSCQKRKQTNIYCS